MRIRTLLIVLLSVTPVGAQHLAPSHDVTNPRPAVREVALVNGVALTSSRLDTALNAILPFESFHRNVSPAKLDELRSQALDRIVNEELEYQEGVRLGIHIPDARVQEQVASLERQYGTRRALDAGLVRSGATMDDLRRELRRTLTLNEAFRRAVTATCQVSRAEASAYFAANPDRFVVPEELHVFGITIGVEPSASADQWNLAKARAEDVRRQIAGGMPFADAARTYSTDQTKASGGDMGLLHRGALADEFERATRTLPPGQPSAVVQSLYGYHVIEVTEILPERRQTFADVASTLQKELTSKRCDDRKDAWIAQLRARARIVLVGPSL